MILKTGINGLYGIPKKTTIKVKIKISPDLILVNRRTVNDTGRANSPTVSKTNTNGAKNAIGPPLCCKYFFKPVVSSVFCLFVKA